MHLSQARFVAILAGAAILTGCAQPSGASPSAAASAAPSLAGSSPSAPSTVGASIAPAAIPGPYTEQKLAMVTVDGLRMRTGPGTTNPVVGTAPDEGSDPVVLSHGQLVMIVGPGTTAEGFAWYPVVAFPPIAYRPPRFTGWLADGADGSWLGDPKVQCPPSPTLQQLLQIGYLAGLACYAGKNLTVSGWYPPLPECGGCGGACDSQGVAWMICSNTTYDYLSTTSSETEYGSFLLRIGPQHPVTLPARGNWLTVTGHIDDPAATQCAGTAPQGEWTPLYGTWDSAAAWTFCRVQFVLETAKLRG